MNLLSMSPPDMPIRDVADLTPIQQLIMERLPELLESSAGSKALAKAELEKTLGGEYDPRTSPYYEGLRREAEILEREGLTDLRQSAELGGMFKSGGAGGRTGAEASFLSSSKSNLLKELGALYENERTRKAQAARDIQGIERAGIEDIAAIGSIAEAERSVEEQKNQAIYEAYMQQIMFPYTVMTNIATALLNVQNQAVLKGGGLTDLGWFTALGASMAGASNLSSGGTQNYGQSVGGGGGGSGEYNSYGNSGFSFGGYSGSY